MRLHKHFKPELVVGKPGRYRVEHPWFDGSAVCATDGAMAVRIPVEHDPEHDDTGPIPAQALAAMRKAAPREVEELEFLANGQVIGHGCSFARPDQVPYPDVGAVMPAEGSGAFVVKLNAEKLAKLAKALGTTGVRLEFATDNGPIRVTPVDGLRKSTGAAVGILMPISGA